MAKVEKGCLFYVINSKDCTCNREAAITRALQKLDQRSGDTTLSPEKIQRIAATKQVLTMELAKSLRGRTRLEDTQTRPCTRSFGLKTPAEIARAQQGCPMFDNGLETRFRDIRNGPKIPISVARIIGLA